jgi:hypothetical protein
LRFVKAVAAALHDRRNQVALAGRIAKGAACARPTRFSNLQPTFGLRIDNDALGSDGQDRGYTNGLQSTLRTATGRMPPRVCSVPATTRGAATACTAPPALGASSVRRSVGSVFGSLTLVREL